MLLYYHLCHLVLVLTFILVLWKSRLSLTCYTCISILSSCKDSLVDLKCQICNLLFLLLVFFQLHFSYSHTQDGRGICGSKEENKVFRYHYSLREESDSIFPFVRLDRGQTETYPSWRIFVIGSWFCFSPAGLPTPATTTVSFAKYSFIWFYECQNVLLHWNI